MQTRMSARVNRRLVVGVAGDRVNPGGVSSLVVKTWLVRC